MFETILDIPAQNFIFSLKDSEKNRKNSFVYTKTQISYYVVIVFLFTHKHKVKIIAKCSFFSSLITAGSFIKFLSNFCPHDRCATFRRKYSGRKIMCRTTLCRKVFCGKRIDSCVCKISLKQC